MSGWLQGRVIENRRWSETLFSLRVAAPRLAFEAGQFVKIALDAPEGRVARPFSFVNPPEDEVLEFYGVVVPDGALSPRLARLAQGDALLVSDAPSGFLVLSEVPDAQTLWLLSTGTGIAPYLSILRSAAAWRRYGGVVLVHAVRYARELAYHAEIESIMQVRGARFRYVSMLSREPPEGAVLAGRIPGAIRDGRLERAAGCALDVAGSQVLLCGNPGMVNDATDALKERGLKKHRRRTPGQITAEAFW